MDGVQCESDGIVGYYPLINPDLHVVNDCECCLSKLKTPLSASTRIRAAAHERITSLAEERASALPSLSPSVATAGKQQESGILSSDNLLQYWRALTSCVIVSAYCEETSPCTAPFPFGGNLLYLQAMTGVNSRRLKGAVSFQLDLLR